MDRYNKNPEGWNIMIDGKSNVLIIGPDIGYRLKLIPLSPQKYTGVGLRIRALEEMRRIVEGVPSYGFRPLTDKDTKEMFNIVYQEGTAQNRLIKKLLRLKPVSTWELQNKGTKAFLSGPVIAHPNLSTISDRQIELEERLAKEANKLFRKKYPERASIYS